MAGISLKLKTELFKLLKAEPNSFGKYNNNGYLDFLNSIWDLKSMPSEDNRYKDAYGDIYQHTVNNDDWEIDYLFLDRLHLLKDDTIFNAFLENIVSPEFKENEEEILKFVVLINSYLSLEDYRLVITDYNELGIPIYKVRFIEPGNNIPLDIKENNIPFFIIKTPTGNTTKKSSHNPPTEFPSFVLVYNRGWNDYSHKTAFSLFYYEGEDNSTYIGEVKIMLKDEEIINTLSDTIYNLNNKYCSLGQSYSYYERLKKRFDDKIFKSVLFALKDAAIYPEILENFEKDRIFRSSLIRDDNAERLLREVKYKINGFDLSNLYRFNYLFTPLYSDDSIGIEFHFNNDINLPNRIYSIIGKNGTGKTQLISSLPIDIYKNNIEKFSPQTPIFSKVIAVSYSIFDKFEIPQKNASFNYTYCGLKNEKGEIYTERGLVLRFHNSWKKIEEIERINKWRRILLNFIEEEIINQFIVEREEITSKHNKYKVSIDEFNKSRSKLSSGQNIILYIVTEIVANIRYDSLLLFDEPETHLHPNAITQLMNTIYELLDEFESYCIITTHSPLIIRELFSKNVFIIDRNGNTPLIGKINRECFGENLTILTDEIFGNREITSQYKTIITNLVKEGYTYKKIVKLLESDNIPLSLNAELYIKSQLSIRKNEKH